MREPDPDCTCARLRRRIALNILLDERTITALGTAAAVLREVGHPGVADLDHAIRAHRIGILKQRAVLGAAGIDV